MTDEVDEIHEWICAALAARKDNRSAQKAWLYQQVREIVQHEERTGIDLSAVKLKLLLHLKAVIENGAKAEREDA